MECRLTRLSFGFFRCTRCDQKVIVIFKFCVFRMFFFFFLLYWYSWLSVCFCHIKKLAVFWLFVVLEFLLLRLASLIWAEDKFGCGINGGSREYVNNNACRSKSTTDENIEADEKMIVDNCRINCRKVADDVRISFGLYQTILLDMVWALKVQQQRLFQNC